MASLLASQRREGRQVGLLIDLSNHETLYAEDIPPSLQYRHIQLVAKVNLRFYSPFPARVIGHFHVVKTRTSGCDGNLSVRQKATRHEQQGQQSCTDCSWGLSSCPSAMFCSCVVAGHDAALRGAADVAKPGDGGRGHSGGEQFLAGTAGCLYRHSLRLWCARWPQSPQIVAFYSCMLVLFSVHRPSALQA